MKDKFKFWNPITKYMHNSYVDNNNVLSEFFSDFEKAEIKFQHPKLIKCAWVRDKNKRLAWGGDVVKIPDDYGKFGMMAGEIREIYFLDGCFRFKPIQSNNGRGHTIDDCFDECEIIGNIYENPELLKQ